MCIYGAIDDLYQKSTRFSKLDFFSVLWHCSIRLSTVSWYTLLFSCYMYNTCTLYIGLVRCTTCLGSSCWRSLCWWWSVPRPLSSSATSTSARRTIAGGGGPSSPRAPPPSISSSSPSTTLSTRRPSLGPSPISSTLATLPSWSSSSSLWLVWQCVIVSEWEREGERERERERDGYLVYIVFLKLRLDWGVVRVKHLPSLHNFQRRAVENCPLPHINFLILLDG